ncbi:MAG TPA: hypothetical protein PLT26_16695 [Anaerolineaceae bacterium]|nr:hypothetical protein [Anaerolineaceae bacterium]HQH87138.1 hypothetical protein [Anaerolineaceae bacterium]
MKYKWLRILIGVLTGFIALTAIGGGAALLTGMEGKRFPLEWLQGSIFKGYTIPGLLLVVVVGGSALVACITIFRKLNAGILAAMVAGLSMMGFIIGEFLILKQVPPGPTPIELFYFGLGLVIFLLGGLLWMKEKRSARH